MGAMALPPKDTLAGAIKWAASAQGVMLKDLAAHAGLKPDSLRQRISITRGKRALQPWQVSKIAAALKLDEKELHRLAAQHEGWKV